MNREPSLNSALLVILRRLLIVVGLGIALGFLSTYLITVPFVAFPFGLLALPLCAIDGTLCSTNERIEWGFAWVIFRDASAANSFRIYFSIVWTIVVGLFALLIWRRRRYR